MRGGTWLAIAFVSLPFAIGATLDLSDRDGVEAFTWDDTRISESSGLVVLDAQRIVTTNDSGDSARVYVVDPGSGKTIDTPTWDGPAGDVEALAPAGDNAVWVGDIGDNQRKRASIQVIHLPLDGGAATTFDLVYPDRAHDAEALLAHPVTGQLFVVTKGVFGGKVYAAPTRLRAGRANKLKEIAESRGIVTDGAFLPSGGAVVLRDYQTAWVVDATTWTTVTSWRLPREQQAEGLAVDTTGEVPALLLSTEGMRTQVLREPLPAAARAADVFGSPGWRILQALPFPSLV
jgi:DNA-binding beta-propeller fold protein YncE